ncbi:PLC-like phosphodiesterase [Ephemerocybe angulata]|uniref:PLC-like phosphodiesterase n=1 Tax=Ephemerocybe angulata TaxID=980116 RepID=A0A8H6HCA4_9AGAR|nr:PLC-like phosphodiesterase [Tulosesus angulatus]
MKFCIYNLTNAFIEASTGFVESIHEGEGSDKANIHLQPGKSTTISKFRGKYVLLHGSSSLPDDPPELFRVSLPGFWAKRGASWKAVKVENEGPCPWRLYWFWPAKALVVVPRRDMASFLSELPDSLSLASLVLPGTHDTMAFYGWPISQCQSRSSPLSTQFLQGIRVIDVRLAVIPVIPVRPPKASNAAPGIPFPPGKMAEAQNASAETSLPTPQYKLVAYHGIYPQRTPFSTILSSIHTFLTSPAGCKETIVMSIKQEDFSVTPGTLFSRLVREEIQRSPGGFKDTDDKGNRELGIWFLENRVPTLGEARGKCVLLSRFGIEGAEWEGGWEGMGIHPLHWPNSEKRGFVWYLKGTAIRTHDWYAIPSFLSIPEKTALSTLVLQPSVPFPLTFPLVPSPEGGEEKEGTSGNDPMLNITYLSAAMFPLALPPTVAKGAGWPGFKLGFEGVNARVGRWLLEELAPDLKTFSTIKSASAPKAPENGYGAVKQAPVDDARQKKRREGLRWLRPKATRKNCDTPLLEGALSPAALDETVLAAASRIRGWALMDYYSSEKALVPLLVEFNHRGRRSGEEGWP